MDDDFMRCLFQDNISLVEFVLRTVVQKGDLVIIEFETQKDLKRVTGARSICLDAYGRDSLDKRYNMEVQRADKGSEPERARYHSSAIDIQSLDAGQDFTELPETFVIFITEKDFFGRGQPVYHIERINLESGEPFLDREHILYVNGEYRGDSDIGKLMHDFCCSNPDDMYFKIMADSTRYLKENPKGVSRVCRIMEEMREETLRRGIEQNKKATALRMLDDGTLSVEKISEFVCLPVDEVRKLNANRKMEQGM